MTRLLIALLLVSLPLPVAGQAPDSAPSRQRVATLTAGTGNALGWFGVQGERYWRDRYSGYIGLGYTPSLDDYPSGPTFAAGVRGYTGGYRHRGFLELSFSQLVLFRGFGDDDGSRLYGPGLQGGYQLATSGGFTAMVSAGIGYAPTVPEGNDEVGWMGGLSVGYTWRR
jgi:hypothetical protein